MSSVGIREAIKYGFVLLGYFAVIFLVGGFITFVGFLVFGAGAQSDGGVGGVLLVIVGGILAFIGILMIYAGLLGTGYKVIADGVKSGVENSDGFDTEGGTERKPLRRGDRSDQGSSQ